MIDNVSRLQENLNSVSANMDSQIVKDYLQHEQGSSFLLASLSLTAILSLCVLIFVMIRRSDRLCDQDVAERSFILMLVAGILIIFASISAGVNGYNYYCYTSAPDVYAAQYLMSFK